MSQTLLEPTKIASFSLWTHRPNGIQNHTPFLAATDGNPETIDPRQPAPHTLPPKVQQFVARSHPHPMEQVPASQNTPIQIKIKSSIRFTTTLPQAPHFHFLELRHNPRT